MSYHSSGQMLDWGHQQTPKLPGTKYRYFGHGFPGFFLHNQSDWETGKVVEKTEACVILYVSWCFYGDRCKQGANFNFEMLLLLILISFETFSLLVLMLSNVSISEPQNFYGNRKCSLFTFSEKGRLAQSAEHINCQSNLVKMGKLICLMSKVVHCYSFGM